MTISNDVSLTDVISLGNPRLLRVVKDEILLTNVLRIEQPTDNSNTICETEDAGESPQKSLEKPRKKRSGGRPKKLKRGMPPGLKRSSITGNVTESNTLCRKPSEEVDKPIRRVGVQRKKKSGPKPGFKRFLINGCRVIHRGPGDPTKCNVVCDVLNDSEIA